MLPPSTTPDWYPDPTGRHQYRYHDGTDWTAHVADDGRAALDPMPAPSVPPAVPEPITPSPGPAGTDAPAWVDAPTGAIPTSTFPMAGTHPTAVRTGPAPGWATTAPGRVEPTPPGGVTMEEAVRRCLRKYAVFAGRAPRSEYWWFTLAYGLTFLVVWLLTAALAVTEIAALAVLAVLLLLTLSLGAILPTLAVTVRRLHDTGRSGWWYLIAFVPFVGPIVLLVFLCTEGERTPNVYGPPTSV